MPPMTTLRLMVLVAALSALVVPQRARGGVRDVRERPGPAAGAVAGRHHAVRGQHARRPARDLRRRRSGARRTSARCRSASSRSRSRRAPTPRCGSSTISPTASASSTVGARRRASCARCWSATSRATSSFAGPGGTRAFITTARRGQNVLRLRAGTLDHARHRPRALVLGVRRDNLGGTARRHAETIMSSSATRRARWRRPGRRDGLRGGLHSGNQTTTRHRRRRCATAAPPPGHATIDGIDRARAVCRRRTPTSKASRPRGRSDRASTTRRPGTGRTSSAATGAGGALHAAGPRRVRDRRRDQPAGRRRRSRTSAPCCSTWSSTR